MIISHVFCTLCPNNSHGMCEYNTSVARVENNRFNCGLVLNFNCAVCERGTCDGCQTPIVVHQDDESPF